MVIYFGFAPCPWTRTVLENILVLTSLAPLSPNMHTTHCSPLLVCTLYLGTWFLSQLYNTHVLLMSSWISSKNRKTNRKKNMQKILLKEYLNYTLRQNPQKFTWAIIWIQLYVTKFNKHFSGWSAKIQTLVVFLALNDSNLAEDLGIKIDMKKWQP